MVIREKWDFFLLSQESDQESIGTILEMVNDSVA